MDPRVAEIMRRKTASEKMAIVDGLWRTARQLVRGSLRQQHPGWTEDQLDRETARRMSRGA